MRLQDLPYYPLLWFRRLFPEDPEKIRERHEQEIIDAGWTKEDLDRMHHIDLNDPEMQEVLSEIRAEREKRMSDPRGVSGDLKRTSSS